MDDYGKVSKEKARQLIQFLKDKRVLVKLVVKNTGYESVTVITDIKTIDGQAFSVSTVRMISTLFSKAAIAAISTSNLMVPIRCCILLKSHPIRNGNTARSGCLCPIKSIGFSVGATSGSKHPWGPSSFFASCNPR